MGKRQQAALETRQKLLDAVQELLQQKRADDISIEDVTTKAGVAKGSFYTYFKRKEDAICAVALGEYNALRDETFGAAGGVYESLCLYLNRSVRIIEDYTLQIAQGWMKSVTSPLPGETGGIEKYTYDRENIQRLLEDAVRRGELAPDTPTRELTEIILNCYYGAVATWCITGGEAALADAMEHFCLYGLKAILTSYTKQEGTL